MKLTTLSFFELFNMDFQKVCMAFWCLQCLIVHSTLQWICWTVLFILGWSCPKNIDGFHRVTKNRPIKVVCVSPHTSRWDLIYTTLFRLSYNWTWLKQVVPQLSTKMYNYWGIQQIADYLGIIPNTELDDYINHHTEVVVISINPCGYTKTGQRWTSEFSTLASNTNASIGVIGLDYIQKRLVFHIIIPSKCEKQSIDDICNQLQPVYQSIVPKFPEQSWPLSMTQRTDDLRWYPIENTSRESRRFGRYVE